MLHLDKVAAEPGGYKSVEAIQYQRATRVERLEGWIRSKTEILLSRLA